MFYCFGPHLDLWILLFADDYALIAFGPKAITGLLACLWLLAILEVPVSWKKGRGGVAFDWIGLQIVLRGFRIGLSERRAEWVIRWALDTVASREVVIQEFGEAVGRLSFAARVLADERPFLAPLFKLVSLYPPRAKVRLPIFALMILQWLALRVRRRRLVECREQQRATAHRLRVDAKAEGDEVCVGGWRPTADSSGRLDTRLSPWFSIRLSRESAPWCYSKGEPFRTIMALELFALLCAVILLGPEPQEGSAPPHERGRVVLPSLADNEGSVAVTFKGVSSTFPLCLVSMELVAQCEARRYRIEPGWVPRSLNQEADDLSNGKVEAFASELRRGTDSADCLKLLVLPGFLAEADAFYKEMKELKEQRRGSETAAPKQSRKRRRVRLRDRDPW